MTPVNFGDRIGQDIDIALKRGDPARYYQVKLVGVDWGGIWIESQNLVNTLLQASGQAASHSTPVVFLPYGELSSAIVSIPQTALDEKAFGL